MTDQQIVLRGKEAAQILESEVFKDAMKQLKESVIEQWKQCPIRDQEGQMLLLQLCKVTDKFESSLIGLIKQGKFTERKIEIDAMRKDSKARAVLRRVVG